MKILIVKLSAIGDVIHTLPALNAIRRRYPGAEIDWLVEEAAASLVEGHEALDRVIVSRRKRWLKALFNGPNRARALRSILRFIRELRTCRYDLIIDFQQLMKSGVMVWLARGDVKAGFDGGMEHMEESHRFLNRRIPPVSMEIHALERYLILVRALGIPVEEIEYNIPVSGTDQAKIDRTLAESGVSGERPLIAINPVAQWPTKLWDTAGFAEVADRLTRDFGADVVFTGGPEDRPVVAEILGRMARPVADFTGRTSLKELAALYGKPAPSSQPTLVRCTLPPPWERRWWLFSGRRLPGAPGRSARDTGWSGSELNARRVSSGGAPEETSPAWWEFRWMRCWRAFGRLVSDP